MNYFIAFIFVWATEFYVQLGMGTALETLCGQAVGAGKLDMIGVYMQRSWIITGVTAFILTPIYVCASPLLKLLHQTDDVSESTGKFCVHHSPALCICCEFSHTKVLPSSKQGLGYDHCLRSGIGPSCAVELGPCDQAWLWSCWSCYSGQHILVGHQHSTIGLACWWLPPRYLDLLFSRRL